MVEQSNNWKEIRLLLQRIEEGMLSSLPTEGVNVTPADTVAFGMYWRCMSLYRGILVLLDNSQPEEALMLWRSLFTDSLRMRELEAAAKKDRIAIELGYYVSSLERMKHRIQRAKELGVTDDITSELANIEKQKRDIENYRQRLEIGKLSKFSSEENLIKAQKRTL